MYIQAQIDENGMVKVSDPGLWGNTVVMTVVETKKQPAANETEAQPTTPEMEEWIHDAQTWKGAKETDWEAIKAIVREMDKLDFPRRSHEEIIRDLHEIRG